MITNAEVQTQVQMTDTLSSESQFPTGTGKGAAEEAAAGGVCCEACCLDKVCCCLQM